MVHEPLPDYALSEVFSLQGESLASVQNGVNQLFHLCSFRYISYVKVTDPSGNGVLDYCAPIELHTVS